ncbi:MAG: hypothetical protein J6T57_01655, partial [Alphaproteobacteria bacterium]|nr:hypothetical protein [Alphaproteobacteria bacterium]
MKSIMIQTNCIFDDIDEISCGWIADGQNDETDLASAVDFFNGRGIHVISVPTESAEKIWPWIEKEHTKIIGRFKFGGGDSAADDLSESVMRGFRQGLSGAQVFVPLSAVGGFVNEIFSIRDDLFFRRHFSVAIDIDGKVSPSWDTLFDNLKKIRID